MATQEEIRQIVQQLQTFPAPPVFTNMHASMAGEGAVIRLLSESETGQVTAGQIAECMQVSTARVAALLKKMEAKDLLVRQRDETDGRVTIVRLSPQGQQLAQHMRHCADEAIARIIDKVGVQHLLLFLDVARQIAEIKPPLPCHQHICSGIPQKEADEIK